MPQYSYRARNSLGELVQGTIEASSAEAVAAQLLNTGVTPIDIGEAQTRSDAFGTLRARFSQGTPSLDDLILFCRQMYTLTRAGVPIIRGITGLAETTRHPALAEVLKRIRIELEAGRELSTALAQFPHIFSSLVVSMVKVGENTGRLEEAFLQLARYLELERDTRNRVKTALRYPTFVLVAISIAIAVVNIFVIPAFANVFASMKTELPWQTRMLIATSDFFVAWWPAMLVAVAISVIGFNYWIKTENGRYRWDRFKLHIPIAGSIIQRALLGRFARSFAMTMRSGVPLIQALTVVARAVDNTYVAQRIVAMRTGVERGDSLSRTAATTGMFTPLVLQMMNVGEETGGVDAMMDEVADFYEREVDYDLKNLASSIEPILIVAVGVLVLILALGIFLPMWDLTQLARR
ncbi:MAG: type II secretion system F family protein [Thiohalomonadaceae bacterium]